MLVAICGVGADAARNDGKARTAASARAWHAHSLGHTQRNAAGGRRYTRGPGARTRRAASTIAGTRTAQRAPVDRKDIPARLHSFSALSDANEVETLTWIPLQIPTPYVSGRAQLARSRWERSTTTGDTTCQS